VTHFSFKIRLLSALVPGASTHACTSQAALFSPPASCAPPPSGRPLPLCGCLLCAALLPTPACSLLRVLHAPLPGAVSPCALARFWPPLLAVTATNVSAVNPPFNDKMAGHRRPRPSSSVTDDGAEANRRVNGRFALEDVQELAAAVAVAMAPMPEEEVKAVCEAVRDQVSTEADRLVQDDRVLLGFVALVKAELVAHEQRADKTQDIAAAMAVIVVAAMV